MLKNKLKIYNKSVLGIIIILLWSSYLPNMYPTPFQYKTGIKKLAKMADEVPEWIKEEAGYEGYTREDLEKQLRYELIFTWFKWLLMILTGILSGFLFIRRGHLGYILAIFCLAFFEIMPRLYYFFKYGLFSHLRVLNLAITKKYYSMIISLIRDEIVLVMSVIIFIYLILPSTVKKFKTINSA